MIYDNRPIIKKHSKKEENADLFGAFSHDDVLTLTLLLPKKYRACDVTLAVWNDDKMSREYFPVESTGSDESYDSFDYTFDFDKMCESDGLFYYHFSFKSNGNTLFVSRNYYDLLPEVIKDENAVSSYQLTIFKSDFTTPDDFKGGIMYQIFVDRFARGGEVVPVRDDVVMNDDWYDGVPEYPEYPGGFVRNNMFFGGTLWGVIEKLDYLKSLGVNFIYLNPIFEAYSNHKYDTGDYTKIDPMFGGEEAFDALISAAKEKGIGVILDGVFNHTGSDSVYFNKNNRYPEPGAYNSKDSRYFDWYMFKNYPDDYESWWGIEILPKINGDNKDFRKFICGENGIIRRYLKRGIYGWRLDVADELKEDMLRDIRTALKSEKNGVLIGEVWEDASNKVAYDRRRRYFRGSELDSVMNYPLKNAVVEYLKSSDASGIARITTELYTHYPKAVSDVLMNFLGTHDTERILTVLAGEDISGKTNAELSLYRMGDDKKEAAVELLKTAYLIISTMPGVPCIYYGDEAGLEGARDPFNRLPYPWGKENKELVEWYKIIGEIRKHEKVFAEGYYKVLESTGGVLVYDRFDKGTKITVIINRGNEDYTIVSDTERTSLLSGTVSTTHTVKPGLADIIK